MPGCSVDGCTNSAAKNVKMCYFPYEPERRKAWIERVGRKNWLPSKYSVICQYHFEDHMWEKRRADGKMKLKWNAIPTIFGKRCAQVKNKNAVCPTENKNVYVRNCIDVKNQAEQADVLVDHNYDLSCKRDKKNVISYSSKVASSVISDTGIKNHRKKLFNNVIVNESNKAKIPKGFVQSNCDNSDFDVRQFSSSCTPNLLDSQKQIDDFSDEDIRNFDQEINALSNEYHHEINIKGEYLEKMKKIEKVFEKSIRINKLLKNRLRIERKYYRKKIKQLQAEVSRLKNYNYSKIFNDDQSQFSCTKQKIPLWTDKTFTKSYLLKFTCGVSGYNKLLRQSLPNPSLRILDRKLEGWN